MFELCVLGFLYEKNSYKYELKQNLSELLIFRRTISDGTIYPIFSRLLGSGYIKQCESQEDRHKMFFITDSGKKHFLKLLSNPSKSDIGDFNKFYGYLHFAEYLSSEEQTELIEKRIAVINDRLPYYMKDKNANSSSQKIKYFHHQSELLAEGFYKAEMNCLNSMLNDIKGNKNS